MQRHQTVHLGCKALKTDSNQNLQIEGLSVHDKEKQKSFKKEGKP